MCAANAMHPASIQQVEPKQQSCQSPSSVNTKNFENTVTKSCESFIVDVRRHVSRLYVVVHEMVVDEIVGNFADVSWREVKHHLFLAQSIEQISAKSSYFQVFDAGPCSRWNAVDSVMDDRAESYMTASVRFGFIWTAFEAFARLSSTPEPSTNKNESEASARKGKATAASKAVAALLDSKSELDLGLRQAIDVIRKSTEIIDDVHYSLKYVIFNEGAAKSKENFEYLRKLVSGLRNHYVHGEETFSWPGGDDLETGWQDAKTNALIDRHNALSRVVLTIMQLSLSYMAVTNPYMKVGKEIDEKTNHDEDVLLSLDHVLKHLQFSEYGALQRITDPEQPYIDTLEEVFAADRLRRRQEAFNNCLHQGQGFYHAPS